MPTLVSFPRIFYSLYISRDRFQGQVVSIQFDGEERIPWHSEPEPNQLACQHEPKALVTNLDIDLL